MCPGEKEQKVCWKLQQKESQPACHLSLVGITTDGEDVNTGRKDGLWKRLESGVNVDQMWQLNQTFKYCLNWNSDRALLLV